MALAIADLAQFSFHLSEVPARAQQDTPFQFWSGEPVVLSAPLQVEMAAIALGYWTLQPDDEVAELDVEVRGAHFDGGTVLVTPGLGVATEDPEFRCHCAALPWVVGVVRKQVRNVRRVALAGATFEWSPSVLTLSPRRPGLVSNVGTLPVTILAAHKEGNHPDEFDVDVNVRGRGERLAAALAAGPVTLAPGESASIGGRFYSESAGGVRDATLVLRVDTLADPTEVSLPLRAEPVTLPPGEGYFTPTTINFGFVHAMVTPPGVHPQNLRWRRLALVNGGLGPLVIESLGFADAFEGLTWALVDGAPPTGNVRVPGARYQIDPGMIMIIQINFAPQVTGTFDTAFEAATSSGVLRARILGEGVN